MEPLKLHIAFEDQQDRLIAYRLQVIAAGSGIHTTLNPEPSRAWSKDLEAVDLRLLFHRLDGHVRLVATSPNTEVTIGDDDTIQTLGADIAWFIAAAGKLRHEHTRQAWGILLVAIGLSMLSK